jgi:hypothetical protein
MITCIALNNHSLRCVHVSDVGEHAEDQPEAADSSRDIITTTMHQHDLCPVGNLGNGDCAPRAISQAVFENEVHHGCASKDYIAQMLLHFFI